MFRGPAALLLGLSLAASSQTQNTQDKPAPASTLRVVSHFVVVDVVATDSKGQPVTGLKYQDFQVVEDG